MNNLSLTEQIAQWLINWHAKDIPDDILAVANYYVTDWLGSMLAGTTTIPGSMLIDYARLQPDGLCHIIGLEVGKSAETAALVNGGLSHIVEMDDLDRKSVVHPAAVVIPAALALVQRERLSGQAFLSAVVLGYEIAIRLGEAVGKQHYFYFHNTATCGVFGAAAAAGYLLQLTKSQLAWALGNAGTQAAGLWQFNTNGDMSKHLHAGMAAANGIRAADLARLGFTGASHILEGERGFFAATAPDAKPLATVAGLDDDTFKICGVSIKPHASCRHTHPAIDAALALREQVADGKITACQIDTYPAALDLCDNNNPQTPYAAKFSLQYCVAVALQTGQVGLSAFSPETLKEPAYQPLLACTTAILDTAYEQEYPDKWAARVTVTLTDGTQYTSSVDHPQGDPENALSLTELQAKFHQLADYGGQPAQPWLNWIKHLATSYPITWPL